MGDDERRSYARVVLALGRDSNATVVANAYRQSGFRLRNDTDVEQYAKFAALFFDSDYESGKLGYSSPQEYFQSLMAINPLTKIPEEAVMIARTSFLFRGMAHVIGGGHIRTSKYWLGDAEHALEGTSGKNAKK